MALRYEDCNRHAAVAIADRGRCLFVCDADGVPVRQLPPVVEINADESRHAAGDFLARIVGLTRDGETHPVVGDLVDERLVSQDDTGALRPDDAGMMMVVDVQADGRRVPYLVPSRDVDGVGSPSEMLIEGFGLLKLLEMWPCPSVPVTWQAERMELWPADAGGTYETAREYAPIEMAAKIDGYTVTGPAEPTIQKLIQDSLDAGNRVQGWDAALVVDMASTGNRSLTVNIVTDDRSVWETISEPALLAGVTISVDMWWPGDEPVLVRRGSSVELVSWDWPMGVIRVRQTRRS